MRKNNWTKIIGLVGLMVVVSLITVKFSGSSVRRLKAAGQYGPQTGITCPDGSYTINNGEDIPSIVNSQPAGTVFCIKAGTYTPSSPIMPKANQKLIGEYGAVIDGANVSMDYDIGSTSIIRGWNCVTDCSGVTIQNLVIKNLKAYGCIGVNESPNFVGTLDNWTIDHNEVYDCKRGINVGAQSGAKITNNYVHNNIGVNSDVPEQRGFGVGGYYPRNTLFENNEVTQNGTENKWSLSTNVITRNNYIHNQVGDGIWYDGDNVGALIEGNLVEDVGREGIFYEISSQGIIRNNTVRRAGSSGVFLSTSRDVEVYGNIIEDSLRGVNLFLNCSALGYPYPGSHEHDLRNNNVHDNYVKVGTQPYASAPSFGATLCNSTQLAPYASSQKNLVFSNNKYVLPSSTASYYLDWSGFVSWKQWKAIPQDVGTTITTYSPVTPPPPPSGSDITPPAVNISTPPESSTVYGTVSISATASDNVGVIGVQFRIDGNNLGVEDTAAPYSIAWNTTTYPNGNHVMSAVARDAAGNKTTSTPLGVTVSNSATTPPPPPHRPPKK